MALSAPVDREFEVLPSGHIRDRVVLANFREGLRSLVNPETGQLFTEDEIQRATQPGSRWYVEAQAIDDYGQAEQRGAIWLSDQIRLERASTKWLEGYHGRVWGESKLGATGGSGPVEVRGVPGTIVVGSTALGDPNAYKARDPAGNVYQAFQTITIGSGGTATVTMAAISTGAATNIDPALVPLLTWTLRDPNMEAQAPVLSAFTGGTNVETDAEYSSRMANIARHRPGAGNDAHFRAWARAASNAIEDGFIYPCAFHAGSVLVAITQKRGATPGRLGRIPNAATLTAAIGALTPPLSQNVPPRARVLVTSVNAESSNLSMRLQMARGSSGGWTDARPFPSYHAITPKVISKLSDTNFTIQCPGDATLPGQAPLAKLEDADAPKLMLWRAATSRFVELSVASVEDLGANQYRVILTAPPSDTRGIAAGEVISPDAAAREDIALAIEEYFDELGPGDLFDLSTDVRGGRCVRFPLATEERPYRAGAVVATRVIESLGGGAADAVLESISKTTPSYPANLTLGPNMLVPGTVGIYPL